MYRDRGQRYTIVDAAGPHRVSGDVWDAAYAREYYQCVNDAGVLVWLYRDARTNAWYLHGWWD
jgi:protein ImuB